MQREIHLRPKPIDLRSAGSRLLRQRFPERLIPALAFPVLALLILRATVCGSELSAQQQKDAANVAHADSKQHRYTPEAEGGQSPAAPISVLPANQPPNSATVRWGSRGLEIQASNSSLEQILHQIAADTGAKLEGPLHDQRVFGNYGPGPACDVLSKLLDGSGYNVLIVGGSGAGVPLKIMLSVRSAVTPQTVANNRNRSKPVDDDAAEPPPELPTPSPMKTPFGNGDSGAEETPQQVMEDILDRQHKIDLESQKQDQQKNPQQ